MKREPVQLEIDEGRFTLVMYALAQDGQLFDETAATSLIGRTTPIAIGIDEPEFVGTITEAEVVDEGKSLRMVVKLENMPDILGEMLEDTRFMH